VAGDRRRSAVATPPLRAAPMIGARPLAALMFGLAAGLGVLAAPTPAAADVWLRIDAQSHSAPIMRLAVDPTRDRVVTASDDKTARIWSLSDGRPITVLRPPVGPARVGRLYGAAFHPTEDKVAVAGTGSPDHPPGPSIFVFEASTGRFVQRIDARGEHVRRLAYSSDGKLLACYAQPGAIRVFDTGGALLYEEPLGGDCDALASRGTRMVAASRDGTLHLFELHATTVSRTGRAPLAAMPFAVDLSPDGIRAVVGFVSTGAGASVHRTDTGAQLLRLRSGFDVEDRRPGTSDPINRTQSVAWALDGRTIATGGNLDLPGRTEGRLRRFDAASGQLLSDLAVAEDTVVDLAALPARSATGEPPVAWASFDGRWGVAAGGASEVRAAPKVPFLIRRGAGELRLSPDARQVRWMRGAAREPLSFELPARRVGAGDPSGLRPAVTRLGLFDAATQFENHFEPMVRNQRVPMAPQEVSRALTYVGNEGHVVLATDLGLRRLDRSLQVVWQVRTATEVRAVNASDDGELVVTTMSDGTVRWWRAADGALLLTLLAAREGWVLWTPTGHYDASHGGESLIGWLVDRPGAPIPDYFGVGRFRDQFLRPDVIDRVLDTRDPAQALRLADAQRAAAAALSPPASGTGAVDPSTDPAPGPPATADGSTGSSPARPSPPAQPSAPAPAVTVTTGSATDAVDRIRPAAAPILPPVLAALEPLRIVASSGPRTFRFTVRPPDPPQPVRVEVRLDGRRVDPQRVTLPPAPDSTDPAEITVDLPAGVRTVQLVARAGDTASEPLRFLVDGDPVAAIEPTRPGGTLYLLAVGISRYADASLALQLPAKDAQDFVTAMGRQRGVLYRDVVTRLLTDRDATAAGIRQGLDWLRTQVSADDVGIVFLAGHGVNPEPGRYRFLPYDYDRRRPTARSVDGPVIAATLAELRGRGLLFLDTCHAGAVPAVLSNVSRDTSRIANQLSAPENAVSVFASSTERQESFENLRWGNGAFTRTLVEGLAGAARLQPLELVTARSLSPFLTHHVSRLTEGRQTPVSLIPDTMPDRILSALGASAWRQ
jgi:hypothetical protein